MNEITEQMKKLIEKNALAVATIDKEGKPHCIATGFAKVISHNQILLTDNFMIQTTKNIEQNPNIALSVWNRDWEGEECEGYEFQGIAEYFKEGKWLEEVKKIPENKGLPCKGAILSTINKIKKCELN